MMTCDALTSFYEISAPAQRCHLRPQCLQYTAAAMICSGMSSGLSRVFTRGWLFTSFSASMTPRTVITSRMGLACLASRTAACVEACLG